MRGSLGAIIPAMASLGTLYTFLVKPLISPCNILTRLVTWRSLGGRLLTARLHRRCFLVSPLLLLLSRPTGWWRGGGGWWIPVSPNTHLEVSWLTTHCQGGGCKEEPVEVEGQGVQRGEGAARDCGEEAAERGGRGEERDQNHLQQRVPPSFRQDRDPDEPQPMGGNQHPLLLPCHCIWGASFNHHSRLHQWNDRYSNLQFCWSSSNRRLDPASTPPWPRSWSPLSSSCSASSPPSCSGSSPSVSWFFRPRFSPRKPLFLACASAICLGEATLATHHHLTRFTFDNMILLGVHCAVQGDLGVWISIWLGSSGCDHSGPVCAHCWLHVNHPAPHRWVLPNQHKVSQPQWFSKPTQYPQILCVWNLRSVHGAQPVCFHQSIAIGVSPSSPWGHFYTSSF